MTASPTTQLVIEPLSFVDQISPLWRYPLLFSRFLVGLISVNWSPPEVASLHWRQKCTLAFTQASRATWSSRQGEQSRKLLTGPALKQYCHSHGLNHKAVALGHDTVPRRGEDPPTPIPVLHFIAAPQTQPTGPTILYFHGGGYQLPMEAGAHGPFALKCVAACHARRVAFLEYSLTPEHQYPCQMVQAVAALRYLLENEGLSPENIILGGDSAGGHLVLSLLTHLACPSPYASPVYLQGRQFKAVVGVSPWSKLSWPQAHALRPAPYDFMTKERVEEILHMFNHPSDEVWGLLGEQQELLAVWKKAPPGSRTARSFSRKWLLTIGDAEILYDSCLEFGQGLLDLEVVRIDGRKALDLVQELDYVLAVAPGEAHVQAALDCATGVQNGRMLTSILAFLAAC